MGAYHSFYVKTIETHARAFLPLNISAIGTVSVNQIDDLQSSNKTSHGPSVFRGSKELLNGMNIVLNISM